MSNRQRGLTLVELLLAIVIVSLILGAAYTVASATLGARARYDEVNSAEAVLNSLEMLLRRDCGGIPLKNPGAQVLWETDGVGKKELHLTSHAGKGSREGMLCEVIYQVEQSGAGVAVYRVERPWLEGRVTRWGVDSALGGENAGVRISLGTYEDFRWNYSATGNESVWKGSSLVYNSSRLDSGKKAETDDDAPDSLYGINFQISTLPISENRPGLSRLIQIAFLGNSLFVIDH